jgi:hypothetical protein
MANESVTKLSKRELQAIFHVGRTLRLVDCYCGKTDQLRTVAAHKSFGYVMTREDGKQSEMRLTSGDTILGETFSLGFTYVSIIDRDGKLAARYEVSPTVQV